MLRRVSPRVAVVVGYLLVALAFAWPLPLHMGEAFTGDPAGDTGVYVWNQWVFQHEALGRHNPLSTDQILSLTPRVDLSQHNYTAFLNVLALPLIPWLGIVAAFNVVYLASTVITALATYALARRVTSATRPEAWLAGVAFAWSAVLVARSTGHFSLVAAAPLPAFLLCLIMADRSRRTRDAALAGLCMAWAGFSDAYFAVYCLMIAGGYLAVRVVRVTVAPHSAGVTWRWTLNVLIASVGGLVVSVLAGGGNRFDVLGFSVSVRGLYTPVLVLTVLVVARIAMELRPHVQRPSWAHSMSIARVGAVGVLACAAPLSPVLYGLGERMVDGRLASPPTLWRSSPRGVDLAALAAPNPNHAIVRQVSDQQASAPLELMEFTASLSLVAIVVLVAAVWRAGYRPRAGWIWLTAGFAALSLGPFIHIAGINTYVPGPWAVLRYLPMIGVARTPTRFAIVAALGLAILLAGSLAALGRRYPERRRFITGLVGILLIAELIPAPRTLYSAAIPSVYSTIAADPRPVRILNLPFGVRDGVSSAGNFSAMYQYYQTLHGKKLIGGYLSRISARRLREMRDQPTLDALLTMSEGGTLSAAQAAVVRERGPRFIARSNLGFVVIDHARTPQHMVDLVTAAWDLERITQDGAIALYRPRAGTP